MTQIKMVFHFIFLLIFASVLRAVISAQQKSRQEQRNFVPSVFFPYGPYNTGLGLALGLGVPIDNGRGDVFMSVCLEANYNQPQFPPLDPPPFQQIYGDQDDDRKLKDVDFDESTAHEDATKAPDNHNDSVKIKEIPFKRLLDTISRKRFFKLVEHQLIKYGFDGKFCLLKGICEVSQYLYSQHNGVLGDIVHIAMTPSTSKDEQLPLSYHKAEKHGVTRKCNEIYGKKCPIGIFDFISRVSG